MAKAVKADRVKGLVPLLRLFWWELFNPKKADKFYELLDKGLSERWAYNIVKNIKNKNGT